MHRRSTRALAAAAILAVAACRPPAPLPPPVPTDVPRLTALLVNGGGEPHTNYWSHLHHLREMRALLLRAGLPAERIWVLASDGDDPAADLSQRRSTSHEDDWILGGGRLDRLLGAKTELVDSWIAGMHLGRADRAGFERWFTRVGSSLADGDTLLLFVTDHGTRDPDDDTNNRITLWGRDETLSVHDLRGLIDDHLRPGVRVVTIMSQCFSGAFAHLAELDPDSPARRPVCGFFSTTAQRQAFGCYPEAAERDDRGHAIRMAEALARLGGLPVAHDAAVVWDDTPDVPLRSSDVFLESVLASAAARAERPLEVFIDEELALALADSGRFEPTLRLLDDVAAHYGLFSPRRLAELDDRTAALEVLTESFGRHRTAWRAARASAADANADRWLADSEDAWRERLAPQAVTSLDADARAALRSDAIQDLARHTRGEHDTLARLTRLDDMTRRAEGVTYRTEVRLGVLLRMRQLLTRIAGESFVARAGTPAERARLDELLACETLRLTPRVASRSEVEPPKAPLPSFDEDEATARTFQPSWLGVNFQRPPEALVADHRLSEGAAFVGGVFDGSAAATAGIRPGDVILGPPDAPFREPAQLREWTMFHSRGVPAPLRILRSGRPLDVVVRLQPFPTEFPTLPAPPSEGDRAPALEIAPYRGTAPASLANGRRTLLFFWATWCSICKAALPELEGLARRADLDLVAITDEPSRTLDGFFSSHQGFFPRAVAIDPARATFLAYGVNRMPTFVLVGADGRIQRHHVGYRRSDGLPF